MPLSHSYTDENFTQLIWEINEDEKFVAHNFEGKYLDCGTMSGYINTSKEIGKI